MICVDQKGWGPMRKKHPLCFVLAICLLFGGCAPKEEQPAPSLPIYESTGRSEAVSRNSELTEEDQPEPSLPIYESTDRSEAVSQYVETTAQYFIEQRDEPRNGELTEADVTRLWYLTNTLYDADDMAFVKEVYEPVGAPFGSVSKFLDFEEATRYLFTSHGLEQLISAQVGGAPYLYKAEDGAVYHLGPYKTGYSYQQAMTGCRIISSGKDNAQVEVSYQVMAPLDWDGERPEAFATMFLQKEDGRWKVDSYNFPEGIYPEEFTVTEEVRIQLIAGEKEVTLSDTARKDRITECLRSLTEGVLVQEAPPQDSITVKAVDNDRVYHVSVGPDGRAWDTLYAEGEWFLYQTDPEIYQELQDSLA